MTELLFLQQALGIQELHLHSAEVKDNQVWLTAVMIIGQGVCPSCEAMCEYGKAHQYLQRSVRHIPVWNRPTWIMYLEAQMVCPECGRTFVPRVDFLLQNHPDVTRQYAEYLFERVRGSSIKIVAGQEGIAEKTLEAIYYAVAEERERNTPLERTTHVGIDEISTQKGHGKFKAVIYDLKRGKVLDLLQTREKAALVAYFRGKPRAWLFAIRVVSIDMWGPYRQAVREVFGDRVTLVADKFHVVKLLNEKIHKCRRAIQRDASQKVKEKLKGIRWAIVKDPANLSWKERKRLHAATRHSPELRRMYELKKAFLHIYRVGRRQPIRKLRRWMKKALGTGLVHLEKFVKTLENWWDEVTAYFKCGLTNAGGEGCNTVIKLVHRRAFGFRNHRHFVLRVKHETGALSAEIP